MLTEAILSRLFRIETVAVDNVPSGIGARNPNRFRPAKSRTDRRSGQTERRIPADFKPD
jgi:hypothetical protein